jgi:hypothetical protein
VWVLGHGLMQTVDAVYSHLSDLSVHHNRLFGFGFNPGVLAP